MSTLRHSLVLCLQSLSAIVLVGIGSVRADVTALVEVPNGETNFYGLLRWSLNEPGQLPSNFEIEIAPGMSAADIAYSMELESDGVAGISAQVAGNVYLADDVVASLVGVPPAEVEITWSVMTEPSDPVPHPNYPLKVDEIPWYPYHTLQIVFTDERGLSTHFRQTANVYLTLVFLLDTTEVIECRAEGRSTESLAEAFDNSMRSQRMPEGVVYAGMQDGAPMFLIADEMREITAVTSGRGTPELYVGAIYQTAERSAR